MQNDSQLKETPKACKNIQLHTAGYKKRQFNFDVNLTQPVFGHDQVYGEISRE